MCGRFVQVLNRGLQGLLAQFDGLLTAGGFNIVPSESIAVVRVNPATGEWELVRLRWGLVPSWAKDLKIGAKMINARSETVAEKPAFRSALKKRRCLVLMDGFYEWQRDVEPSQPWYFCMKDRSVFAIAGLWETWTGPDGKAVETCAMLTTGPNELMQPVHHRLPVIVAPADYGLWLNPGVTDPAALARLYAPYPADRMDAWKVSRLVNRPGNSDPKLIEPV